MIDIAPFEPGDLFEIDLQPQQVAEMAGMGDWRALADAMLAAGPAWTLRHQGRVLGCGGVGVLWRGRAEAWCFLANDIPKRVWPALHRIVVRALDKAQADIPVRRLEASCAYGWPQGRRWLEMLGFGEAHLARCYSPDGADFWRFARVRA
jgi:hypothetical protein